MPPPAYPSAVFVRWSSLLLTAFCSACGGEAVSTTSSPQDEVFDISTESIVGGSETSASKGEFVAALFRRSGPDEAYQFTCTGTFIAPDLVLTAAHCSFSYEELSGNRERTKAASPRTARVARRPLKLSSLREADFLEVERVYIHPSYNETNSDGDIAIWKLATRSPGPLAVPASDRLTSLVEKLGLRFRAYGYGFVSDTGPVSESLRQVSLAPFPHEQCRKIHYEIWGQAEGLTPEETITDNVLCAGGVADSGMCSGDSGGPLAVLATDGILQVGVNTFVADRCAAAGEPSGATRVGKYLGWINQCRHGACPTIAAKVGCSEGYFDCDGQLTNGCESTTACAP